ncbi:MAG: DUF2070 family protein [Euryarchaeota archaeon]|nr:DUF2070 family protein [Euryarchaeota archaeon]
MVGGRKVAERGEATGSPVTQAEGAVYRPHERTSRLRFASPRGEVSALGIVLVSLLLPLLAFFPNFDQLPAWPGAPGWWGRYAVGVLIFLVPGIVGTLATTPLAVLFGGRFRTRRALLLGLSGFLIVFGVLLLWRLLTLVAGPFSVEGPLLLGFGLMLWIRQLTLVGVSHRVHVRSLPAALVQPLLGYVMVWATLGWRLNSLVEGVFFLLLALGGAASLVTATDRPMVREFGQGGTSLLRPLMEHMSDRDPAASSQMEAFFEGVSTKGDLHLSALVFRDGTRVRVAVLAPSVHPGPFAELGSSDLPRKLAKSLRGRHADEVMVPHSPSTHAQDIPTTPELQKVVEKVQELIAAASPAPTRVSPLVSPHPGSLARAQVLGDSVLLLLTQAPEPTDDIDYALSELVREDARRLGFSHAIVLDAHNSFVENRGEIPFGSPEGFRLLADAKAAMVAARDQAVGGELRVGFAQERGFNPEDHGMGPEGLSVLVIEGAGTRTAYALFDANNLERGMRDPLVRALEKAVGGAGEVMTTDNHVVHEVQGGTNTLGMRRSLQDLSRDLERVAKRAVANLAPARVGASEEVLRGVKVLGPGVTTRLMTALADSFAIFWLFFLSTIALAALAGALLLAFLK